MKLINWLSGSVATFTILANKVVSTTASSHTASQLGGFSPNHLRIMSNIMNIARSRNVRIISLLEVLLLFEPLSDKEGSTINITLVASSSSVFSNMVSVRTVIQFLIVSNGISP